MPKAKKMGRPKLPKGHAKGVIRPVRFTEAELKVFEKAAKASEHKTARTRKNVSVSRRSCAPSISLKAWA